MGAPDNSAGFLSLDPERTLPSVLGLGAVTQQCLSLPPSLSPCSSLFLSFSSVSFHPLFCLLRAKFHQAGKTCLLTQFYCLVWLQRPTPGRTGSSGTLVCTARLHLRARVFAGHCSALGTMPDSFKVLSLSPSQLDLVLLVAQFYNQGNRGSDGMSHLPKGHSS